MKNLLILLALVLIFSSCTYTAKERIDKQYTTAIKTWGNSGYINSNSNHLDDVAIHTLKIESEEGVFYYDSTIVDNHSDKVLYKYTQNGNRLYVVNN